VYCSVGKPQLNHYSLIIAALEWQMQTRLGDINIRVDDLTTKLKALELHASMNHEIK